MARTSPCSNSGAPSGNAMAAAVSPMHGNERLRSPQYNCLSGWRRQKPIAGKSSMGNVSLP
eukprot:9868278-Lingulodinium_polyedra.AAC.1